MSQQYTKRKIWGLKAVIHIVALLLVGRLYTLAFLDLLGADPVETVLHFTGIGALNLLLLTLVISPIAKACKQAWLMQVRRLLGLYTFTYAFLHVLSFLAFEVQFDLIFFVEEIFKRPYITLGMVAFVLLLALAITSFKSMQRRMGKQWQRLHNCVYLIVILSGIHFYWSVKSEIIEPIFYFTLIAILLWLRRRKFKAWLFS